MVSLTSEAMLQRIQNIFNKRMIGDGVLEGSQHKFLYLRC